MATAGRTLLFAMALIMALTPAIAAAQELPGDPSPTVKSFNLKKINKGSITSGPVAWVVTGKRTSVAFYLQPNDTYTDYQVYSLRISDKGNASAPNSFWSGQGQRVFYLAAVWIPGEEHGLVFLAYGASSKAKQANVVVARFDAEGEIISGFRLLHRSTAPADAHFFTMCLGAAQREDRVAVAAIVVSNEDSMFDPIGVRNSIGQFIEVDTKGKPKGKVAMKFPGAGSRELAWTFKPYWTGKKWLTPITCTHVALGANSYYPNNYYPYGNGLYVMRTELKKDKISKTLLKLLKQDKEEDFLMYRNPQFVKGVSGGTAPGASSTHLLLYSHRAILPVEKWNYSRYSYYFGIQAIDEKSKPVGGTVSVNIPSWTPGNPTQSNEFLGSADRALSFPLMGDDGNIVVAMSRSSTWYNNTLFTYRTAGLLELFSIDPATGDVETLARRDPGWFGYINRPLVSIFGGRIATILSYVDYNYTTSVLHDYFSKF